MPEPVQDGNAFRGLAYALAAQLIAAAGFGIGALAYLIDWTLWSH